LGGRSRDLARIGTHEQRRRAARVFTGTASWDAVFEGVYAGYEPLLARRALAG